MAESYYIRLPFYLVNGSTKRNVNISFDNSVISAVEVTSTDSSAPTLSTFSVVKDPGTYSLKITPVSDIDSTEDFSTARLEDVWVSVDNVTYYSVLLNYTPNKTPLTISPLDSDIGFNPATGATMYSDVEITIDLILPTVETWSKIYNIESIEQIKENYDIINASGTEEQKSKLDAMQQAYDLFKARGYK